MQDDERCRLLTAEFDGVLIDYSRQRVTGTTLRLLEALASAAGVPGKISAMAKGAHLNVTEDRAVGHMALRAPKGQVGFLPLTCTCRVGQRSVVATAWGSLCIAALR